MSFCKLFSTLQLIPPLPDLCLLGCNHPSRRQSPEYVYDDGEKYNCESNHIYSGRSSIYSHLLRLERYRWLLHRPMEHTQGDLRKFTSPTLFRALLKLYQVVISRVVIGTFVTAKYIVKGSFRMAKDIIVSSFENVFSRLSFNVYLLDSGISLPPETRHRAADITLCNPVP